MRSGGSVRVSFVSGASSAGTAKSAGVWSDGGPDPWSGSGGWLSDLLSLDPTLGHRRLSVPTGAVIHEPHAPARDVFLLHRGQVRLFDADPDTSGGVNTDTVGRLTEILSPGEWFGVAALRSGRGGVYGSRAVAAGAVVVTAVSADQVAEGLGRFPGVGLRLVRELSDRLSAAREESNAAVSSDCHARLVRALVRMSGTPLASRIPGGVVLHITHRQLADTLGVARETVSLTLTRLRRENRLRMGRNRLVFDPVRLTSA